MDFGMFMEFQTRTGGGESAAFAEGFALVDAAESWGLDAAWLAEFHFSPQRSVLSSPITVASAIAARTERIRIGMAVYVLPLNNPLRVAEEVATVDQISGGRLDLGVGRSGFTYTYDAYGIPYAQSQARLAEALQVLHKAWLGESFSHQGEYYQVNDAAVFPRPVQRPHPPLRVAASTPATFVRLGEQGMPIFIGLRGTGTAEQAQYLHSYRKAWRDAGHPGEGSVYLRVPLYAGTSEQAAVDEARDTLSWYFERQSKIVSADASRGSAGAKDDARRQTAERLATLSYEDILATRVAVGSSQGLVDRLQQLREELGFNGILAELNAGGRLSADQVTSSLRRLTHEVMPHFK
jgi:alkanesulfonate monooxygenase SsuD/methylene tetrahydromethanopterin reductase-like flavin-dependent oxidoreductase (luciferase family)